MNSAGERASICDLQSKSLRLDINLKLEINSGRNLFCRYLVLVETIWLYHANPFHLERSETSWCDELRGPEFQKGKLPALKRCQKCHHVMWNSVGTGWWSDIWYGKRELLTVLKRFVPEWTDLGYKHFCVTFSLSSRCRYMPAVQGKAWKLNRYKKEVIPISVLTVLIRKPIYTAIYRLLTQRSRRLGRDNGAN